MNLIDIMKPEKTAVSESIDSEWDIPRGLLETLEIPIVILNTEGIIKWFNAPLSQITGDCASDLSEMVWHDLFVSTDSQMSSRMFFQDICAKGKGGGHVTHAPCGVENPKYLEWRFKTLELPIQGSSCFIGEAHDITHWVLHSRRLRSERSTLTEKYRAVTCLYGISQIMANPELSFELKIEKILELIPQAFQYSKIATARIEFDNQRFPTDSISETGTCEMLQERIVVSGRQRGTVTIAYPGQPEIYFKEPPAFLPQERNLLRTLSRQLSILIESNDMDVRKTQLEVQVRHADRLAKIGQLAAGVAHELNTPIGNILGFAQLAAAAPNLPKQVSADLDRIVKSTLHVREIIKKLMLFSRRWPPRRERIDLNALVEEALSFIEPICIRSPIRVIRKPIPDECMISADPSQMNQVLMNLIMNAVHAMPEGGDLIIETGIAGENVYLSVQDTGVGMDADTLGQIFHPFFTTKEIDQGTGLGLSVVDGIIKAHGADITVSSRKGGGSKFTILFPLNPEDERGGE